MQCWVNDDRRIPLHRLHLKPSIRIITNADPHIFDGTQAHAVTPVTGQRYSMVFYSCSRFGEIPEEVQAQARAMCGIAGATQERLQCLRAYSLGIAEPQWPPHTGFSIADPLLRSRIQQNRAAAERRRLSRLHQQQPQQLLQTRQWKLRPKQNNPDTDSSSENNEERGCTGMEAGFPLQQSRSSMQSSTLPRS